MADHEFVLRSEPRTDLGSSWARRLRHQGRIPAVLYGHGVETRHVSVEERTFRRHFEAGHKIYSLQIGNERETGLVKEVQYDPLGESILHVDFARIYMDESIEVPVPIVLVGVPKGVTGGGILDHPVHTVSVEGSALKVPEKIEVQVADLEVEDEIRLKDLPVPEACKILGEPDMLILAIHEPRRPVEEEAVGEEAPAPEEPEVIGGKKEEPEETES